MIVLPCKVVSGPDGNNSIPGQLIQLPLVARTPPPLFRMGPVLGFAQNRLVNFREVGSIIEENVLMREEFFDEPFFARLRLFSQKCRRAPYSRILARPL